jgi:hypothetical protein
MQQPLSLANLCLDVLCGYFSKIVLLDDLEYHRDKSKPTHSRDRRRITEQHAFCLSESEPESSSDSEQNANQNQLSSSTNAELCAHIFERMLHDWALLPGPQISEIVCSVTRRTSGKNLRASSAPRSLSLSLFADACFVNLEHCPATSVETLLLHPERTAPIQTLLLANTGTPAAVILDAAHHLANLTQLSLPGPSSSASNDNAYVPK